MAQQRLTEQQFLESPMEWPRWPILPVKSRTGDFHSPNFCGLVHASNLTRVYFVNMFALGAKEPRPKTWAEAFAGIEFKDYLDVEGLLDEYAVD